jgi:predicted nucleic acid-binding protein
MTECVYNEYQMGQRVTINVSAVDRTFQKVSVTVNKELLPYFHYDASSGEISVISYAMQTRDACCVIDEQFGRTICEIFGIDCTGTVGIIKKMVAEGALGRDSLGLIREKLRLSNFYLTDQLLNELT